MPNQIAEAGAFEQRLVRALFRVSQLEPRQLSLDDRGHSLERILLEARFDEQDHTSFDLKEESWLLNDRMRDIVTYALEQQLSQFQNRS